MGQNDPIAPVQIGQNRHVFPAVSFKNRLYIGPLLPADFNQNAALRRQMILCLRRDNAIRAQPV